MLFDLQLPIIFFLFCVSPKKIKSVKMTKTLLSSSNPDHALNGSTLLLDMNDQLSYIVQESNSFITSHVSDIASEIDQGLGQLKTVNGCNWKVKRLHTFRQRLLSNLYLHPQVGCAQVKQADIHAWPGTGNDCCDCSCTLCTPDRTNCTSRDLNMANYFQDFFQNYSTWTFMMN